MECPAARAGGPLTGRSQLIAAAASVLDSERLGVGSCGHRHGDGRGSIMMILPGPTGPCPGRAGPWFIAAAQAGAEVVMVLSAASSNFLILERSIQV
jgi:hypothetical protein